MWNFQRLAGAVVWSVLVVVQWFHICFIATPAQWWLDNVVTTAEESTKATVREYFSLFGRVINGVASWLVALFVDRSFFYRGKRHQAHKRSTAWQEFIAHSKKRGTFNAVIEQEGLISPSPSPSSRGSNRQKNSNSTIASKTCKKSNSSSWWWPSTTWFFNKPNTTTSTSTTTSTPRNNIPVGRSTPRSRGHYHPGNTARMKRSGSDLFNRPSGFAVSERMDRRGLSESLWLSVELAIESIFTAFRSMVSAVLFLRKSPRGATTPQSETTAATEAAFSISESFSFYPDSDTAEDVGSTRRKQRFSSNNNNTNAAARQGGKSAAPTAADGLPRTRSFGSWEDMGVWTASDVILQAGYPLEEHVVTTSDGYILTMQRIPRKDSKEVVFFMHGILDTALGWVSNGTQGSQAFAAFDRGADVFLGNCRANPPRAHADASRSGAAYWCYSINELGMEDVAAQVYRIHAVKTAELGSVGGFNMASVVGGGGGDGNVGLGNSSSGLNASGIGVNNGDGTTGSVYEKRREISPAAAAAAAAVETMKTNPSPRPGMHKRSGSDSALAAVHNMNIATERLVLEEGAAASAPPNEQQIKAHNLAAAAAAVKAEVEEVARKTNRIGSSSSSGIISTKSRLFSSLLGSGSGSSKLGRTHSGPVAGLSTSSSAVPSTSSRLAHVSSSLKVSTKKTTETIASSSISTVISTTTRTGEEKKKKPLRREGSLSKLLLLGRDASNTNSLRSSSPNTSSSPNNSISPNTSSLEKVKSFKLPDPVNEHDDEEEEEEETNGGGNCSPTLAVLKMSPFIQQRPPPLQIPNSNNDIPSTTRTQEHAQQQQAYHQQHHSSRAPTPDLPTTPVDSTECTPRCAISAAIPPPIDRLMTPDRVSVGGREQAPLQWAVKTLSSGVARRQMSTSGATTATGLVSSPEPYHLQAVGHSLGGAALIIYAVMCKVLGRQHHLSRLVLLTPGGFHRKYPMVAWPFRYILPAIMRIANFWRPGRGAPAYIPSSLLRYITFKLSVDLQHVPALNELTRAGLRLLLNDDASEWDRALQMPHYAVASMPAMSVHTGHHLIQLMNSGKFLLYDYGSVAANRKHYGTDTPPDVAAHYDVLQGLPVDLVAGINDGVIAREDVETHYEAMKAAGLEVTLKELDVGHLDVTFAVKDEVQHYVMSRLKLNNSRGNRRSNGGFF